MTDELEDDVTETSAAPGATRRRSAAPRRKAAPRGQAAPRPRGRIIAVTVVIVAAVSAAAFAVVVLRRRSAGYAAVVNGVAISRTVIDDDLADISANPQYVQLLDQPGGSGPVAGGKAGTYNPSFVAALLDQQIRLEIIRQQLVAARVTPTSDESATAKNEVTQAFPSGVFAAFPPRYQAVLAKQQAQSDAFVGVESARQTTEAINQFYQAHVRDYATESCVRHILIADKDTAGALDYTASLADAQKVKAALDAGGDFAALAKQYSKDNQGTNGGSAAAGGALAGSAADGCLSRSDLQQLVVEFAQAAANLPVNQVSPPVKTRFGYHLIEVTKRDIEPLDGVVTADVNQRMAGDTLNQLLARATVKVSPDYGTFSQQVNASGQILGVVPSSTTVPPAPSTTVPPAPSTTAPPAPSTTVPPAPSTTVPPAPSTTVPPAPSTTVPPAPAPTPARVP